MDTGKAAVEADQLSASAAADLQGVSQRAICRAIDRSELLEVMHLLSGFVPLTPA